MSNTSRVRKVDLTAENPSHELSQSDFDSMANEKLLLNTSGLIETGSLIVGADTESDCHELGCRIWPNTNDRNPRLLHMNITHTNGPFGVFLKSSSHTSTYLKFRNSFEEAVDSEALIVNSYAFREHGTRISILAEATVENRRVSAITFTIICFPYFNNEPYDDDSKLTNESVESTEEATLEESEKVREKVREKDDCVFD